jgi:hypothetical protein
MIGWFFRKLFVAIVPAREGYDVTVASYKQKKRLSKETRYVEGEFAVDEIARYVAKYTEETPF